MAVRPGFFLPFIGKLIDPALPEAVILLYRKGLLLIRTGSGRIVSVVKGNRRILRVSQKKIPETERGYGGRRSPEIRRGLRLSQTYELSIPRLAKYALRNAKSSYSRKSETPEKAGQ